ncbi:MAG: glucosaminidase domain-containing protein [Fusobacteriaceae bacterium]|jgi:Bax protein|nr:glucosaminidase domain-containing protein [Fusobacteriaceae bacterium]
MKRRTVLYFLLFACSLFAFSSFYAAYHLKAANYQVFYVNILKKIEDKGPRKIPAIQEKKIKADQAKENKINAHKIQEKKSAAKSQNDKFQVFHSGTGKAHKYYTFSVKARPATKIIQVKDLKHIAGRSRKEVFIKTLVPIIEEIHRDIRQNRSRVEKIAQKRTPGKSDEIFLKEMYLLYKVDDKNIQKLLNKLVLIPTSLVLAQASLESGWGTSKVALGANNLFGMKSFARDHRGYKSGKSYYKRYSSIQDSVEDYMLTLARHSAYGNLRSAIHKGEKSEHLVRHLNSYSELKAEYGRKVSIIIRANNLSGYDA